MAVNLIKGQREGINIPRFTVGLGWDASASGSSYEFDLDVSVFPLDINGKVPEELFFVFYNNYETPDGSIIHTGDNRTGEDEVDGIDDEQIKFDLSKIDSRIVEMIIVVTIHDADVRRQNFGQVRNSFIRIFDTENLTEILKYELDENFSIEMAVEFGRIYLKNGIWKFEAIGAGSRKDLGDFCTQYGLNSNG